MTDPTPPMFKQGDKVTVPGMAGVFTIASWPATNEGHYVVESFNAEGNVAIRSTLWYSEKDDRPGEPIDPAKLPTLYVGDEGHPLQLVAEDPSLEDLIEQPAAVEDVADDTPAVPADMDHVAEFAIAVPAETAAAE